MARGEQNESFRTYSGRITWPLDPRPEDVELADVAHALARINRFNGHTSVSYSVAEHSVRVSLLVEALAREEHGPAPHSQDCSSTHVPGQAIWCICGTERAKRQPKEAVLWGLLHDASEFLLVDFPRPLKRASTALGAEYREAEGRLMACVCQKFRLPLQQPYLVGIADRALLLAEQRDLMHLVLDREEARVIARWLPPTLQTWNAERAEQAFLQRYTELTGCYAAGGYVLPKAVDHGR